MRILLTNDDGINAPGLYVLEKIAAQLSDDIWICAPSEEQSGAGHSLTLNRPVRLRKHAERRFSVTGTPTDAVTMGLRKVLPEPPDLILSGVNRGANLGDDVTYSGTVSAALEGALAGVRSIALSQVPVRESIGDGVDFSAAEEWGARVLRPLLDQPFAPRTLVNVNFPPLPASQVKGIRVVRQGFHDYARGSLVEGVDPRGFPYFWFGLQGIEHTPAHNTDLEAIAEGHISVTPLHLDLTHDASLKAMAERFAQERATS
ncbi:MULTISPECIES: 5'/3'-nucleotidase SurE [Novosphingobium]|uniref:5'-nucleotidase SurE n=1 Tax=Novosphingobium panipatense TaxID=428991 RepID=A0ABY1Q1E5_9SPHN|nr:MULTISPECIES: 5'/3'-nucleotidase SurE [Novosphingobium]SMP52093.1 5'-nucleotidase /3'-nucleotidase /exopolyphosphatase [Novosphingobium panipatense]